MDQPPTPDRVTGLLIEWSGGNREALDRLLPLVYEELHQLAVARLRRERPNHTLQPTALVHEAYLRLVDQRRADWRNRAQFFGVAAAMMRRILVNHARDRAAQKRGGGIEKVSLSAADDWGGQEELDLFHLDDALTRLTALDARKGQIVDLKFFAGLNTEEIAQVLQLSASTVERDWRFARAWLYDALSPA
jgi:RNA polymerase sigma factor (TIGR02999 family)